MLRWLFEVGTRLLETGNLTQASSCLQPAGPQKSPQVLLVVTEMLRGGLDRQMPFQHHPAGSAFGEIERSIPTSHYVAGVFCQFATLLKAQAGEKLIPNRKSHRVSRVCS